MKFSTPGESIIPGQEPELAPGVRGAAFDLGKDGIRIPFIAADQAGEGAVASFLDSLPEDRRISFPWVVSRRLNEMLLRRGFREEVEEFGNSEKIVVMVRESKESTHGH